MVEQITQRYIFMSVCLNILDALILQIVSFTQYLARLDPTTRLAVTVMMF